MTAARDRLFLLRPDWIDQDRPWFCMACAAVEGFLGYYPAVREALDVAYLPYPRPRRPVADLLGEANQNLPMLILAEPFEHPDLREGDLNEADGLWFATNEGPITRVLAARYRVSPPHP
ncbi:DUF3088 family protein [Caulobacter sp. CCG-8]|uniref:DUF3088 family protein n=1 Tax=Caulobacter sp. CCG-8 TaxID=3127958 RepID=UPI00307D3071